jgi:hypothetical protein
MVVDIINFFIDGINAFPFEALFFYGQLIGLILSLVFLAGIIYLARKLDSYSHQKTDKYRSLESGQAAIQAETKGRDEALKAWKDVLEKIQSKNSSDWVLAVIQADAIFDGILKRMGLPGETMGERLQTLDASKLASLQEVWDAHKLRNRIAHTPATMLRHDELESAVEKYKKALKELEYID